VPLGPCCPAQCHCYCVNGSCLGVLDGKTSGYFLISVASGYFGFISGYVLTSDVVIGLAAPKPPSQVSAGISISGLNSTSGLNSISGSTLIPRPSRARDRVTMAEDGPAPGRFTAGVGSVSRGAWTEPNSPDRSVRPTLRLGSESIILLPAITDKLLTDLGKIEQTAEARI